MSDLNNENTRALMRENGQDIDLLVSWFNNTRATWDEWAVGDDASRLESIKTGLVGLASCIEVRLQEIYAPDHEQTDFGV